MAYRLMVGAIGLVFFVALVMVGGGIVVIPFGTHAPLGIQTVLLSVIAWSVYRLLKEPQLSVQNEVRVEWINEDYLGIFVVVRYKNTSSYHKVKLHNAAVFVYRASPLSEADTNLHSLGNGGFIQVNQLPLIAGDFPVPVDSERTLSPGEEGAFAFPVFAVNKEKAYSLRTVFVDTMLTKDKRVGGKNRGWGAESYHEVRLPAEL